MHWLLLGLTIWVCASVPLGLLIGAVISFADTQQEAESPHTIDDPRDGAFDHPPPHDRPHP